MLECYTRRISNYSLMIFLTFDPYQILHSMYKINSNFNGGEYMTVRFHVHIKPSATCSDLNQKASFYLIQHKLTKIPEQVMHEDVCQYD